MRGTAILFILALSGIPALAQTPAEAPAADQPVAPGSVESRTVNAIPPDAITVKVICVRERASTGSHLGAQKVCHTEQQWAQMRQNGTSVLEGMRTRLNNADPAQRASGMR